MKYKYKNTKFRRTMEHALRESGYFRAFAAYGAIINMHVPDNPCNQALRISQKKTLLILYH